MPAEGGNSSPCGEQTIKDQENKGEKREEEKREVKKIMGDGRENDEERNKLTK